MPGYLPLVPAYLITTHKSQGQTLPKITIDLKISPGMIEVAPSYHWSTRIFHQTGALLIHYR